MTNRTPHCVTVFADRVLGIADYASPALVRVVVDDPHTGPTAVWLGTEELTVMTA